MTSGRFKDRIARGCFGDSSAGSGIDPISKLDSCRFYEFQP